MALESQLEYLKVGILPRCWGDSVHPLPSPPPSPAELCKSRGRELKIAPRFQDLLNSFQNTVQVASHFVVPEAQGQKAVRQHVGVPFFVGCAVQVLAAVKFNNQFPFVADKIGYIAPHRFLAAKSDPHAFAAQVLPQNSFFGRHFASQFAGYLARRTFPFPSHNSA